jgi:hypothetical protein
MAVEPKYLIPTDPLVSQPCWCGSDHITVISKRDRWSQKLTTVMCLSCGTLRLEPRMSQLQAQVFYNSKYETSREPSDYFRLQRNLEVSRYLRPLT